MKRRTIKIPIYFGFLTIIETEDIIGEVRKHGENIDCLYEAVTFKKRRSDGLNHYVVIFLPDANPSVIAHEAIHVKNHLFLDLMMDLDRMNDEAEAYFVGWVFEQIYSFVDIKKPSVKRVKTD